MAKGKCDSCQVISINGLACHETGCPDAWKGVGRSCKECGQPFVPEHQHQVCCDVSCTAAYHGLPDDSEFELSDEWAGRA